MYLIGLVPQNVIVCGAILEIFFTFMKCLQQEAQGLYAELFSFFLCILNVVVIFYYIFINVQLLWLLHSIGPSP